jgi:ethanolamine ammonia-lyase small subunit
MLDWHQLRSWTQARVGLNRKGSGITTEQHLLLREHQALARDSLWQIWNPSPVKEWLDKQNISTLTLSSQIKDRKHYLERPDLGRRLSDASRTMLSDIDRHDPKSPLYDLIFVVTDGLSVQALDHHLLPFLEKLFPILAHEWTKPLNTLPFFLVPFGRVAIADEIGEFLKSQCAIMIVGERPGLSAPDSLGIYLTYHPRLGTSDAKRNCISNIRPPEGLSYELAAAQLTYLVKESLTRRLSGTDLKMRDLKLIVNSKR